MDGVKSPIRPSAKVSRVGLPMKSSARESWSWYLFSVVPEDPPPCVVEPLFGADEEVSDTDDFVGELVAILLHVSTKGTSMYDVKFQSRKSRKKMLKTVYSEKPSDEMGR